MNLYPAIDLYDGKVVRLKRGDYNEATVYSENPVEIAKKWERQGAKWLHVVDLEGAKEGKVINLEALKQIRHAVHCKIEFGGGLRNFESIKAVLAEGIDRVIVGTRALDIDFIEGILEQFGNQIAVGLDVREGKVQMEGWLKEGGKTLDEAVKWLNNLPVETIIYTDIKKDGMLQGPNFEGLKNLLKASKSRIILSGGVASLEDIKEARKIEDANFEGVIIGKAIYEGKFDIEEAAQIAYKA